jgi:hypothetical protein
MNYADRLAAAHSALETAFAPPDGDARKRRLERLADLPVHFRPMSDVERELRATGRLLPDFDDDREIPPYEWGVLTTDHAGSSQGLPVLLSARGPLGPGEVASVSWHVGTLPLVTAAVTAGYRVEGSGYDRPPGGDAMLMPDPELKALGTDAANVVLLARAIASDQLRLVLARAYGRADMATSKKWNILPCLTDAGTIGVLDIAAGTAWDTDVEACLEVTSLGLVDDAYGASYAPAGSVYFGTPGGTMECIQANGVAPGTTLGMPAGWKQIALTRSYQGKGAVPDELYRPETWIRPRLVATGLTTCYGTHGETSAGEYLDSAHGWESYWPWGVPPWVKGESLSVLSVFDDRLRDLHVDLPPHTPRLRRGTDEQEMATVAWVLEGLRFFLADQLRRAAAYASRPPSQQLHVVADDLDSGSTASLASAVPLLRALRDADTRTSFHRRHREISACEALPRAFERLQAGCPTAAAEAVCTYGCAGQVARLLRGGERPYTGNPEWDWPDGR